MTGDSGKIGGFTIFPAKSRTPPESKFPEKMWEVLSEALNKIWDRNMLDLSYEQLYRYVYNMVLAKHGKMLYEGVEHTLVAHLGGVLDVVLAAPDPVLLSTIHREWDTFALSLSHTRSVLLYLDRNYVTSAKKMPVYELGVSLFRRRVARIAQVRDRVIGKLLDMIALQRAGDTMSWQEVKATTNMMVLLGHEEMYLEGDLKYQRRGGVYELDFEEQFLKASADHFAAESQKFLDNNSCSDYLRKVEQCIAQEETMVSRALHGKTTWPKLRLVLQTELLQKSIDWLVNHKSSGMVWMLQYNKTDDIARLYTLLGQVAGGEQAILAALYAEVTAQGTALISNPQVSRDPTSLINVLLEFTAKYEQILVQSFSYPPGDVPSNIVASSRQSKPGKFVFVDKNYVEAVTSACEQVINSCENAAEYLSLYLDRMLRQDFKGCNETEAETTLESLMSLFSYLREKDVLEHFYKLHLSKRLLQNRSFSEDAERWVLSKLKQECGKMYTSKLERMFNDMTASVELKNKFMDSLSDPTVALGSIDFSVNVLTTVAWPITHATICQLPYQIENCFKSYEEFYRARHRGRVLRWQAHVGTSAVLRTRFGLPGDQEWFHELEVSTFHMCVLMLFNDTDEMSYEKILEVVRIREPELKRTLQSLSLGKHRVLVKEKKGKDISENETFSFNHSFSSRQVKIKVQTIASTKETEIEKRVTSVRLDQDRKPQIDAAIVRIMKSRQRFDLTNLTSATVSMLSGRFSPSVADIKKQVESLLEREFLARDEIDQRVLIYKA